MEEVYEKLASILLVLALCFTLTPNTISAAVKLNKTKVTVEIGKTTTLKISGTTKAVKRVSNNKEVATVSLKGIVKAIAVGEAPITAPEVSEKKYTYKVTVKNGFNAETASKNIGGNLQT